MILIDHFPSSFVMIQLRMPRLEGRGWPEPFIAPVIFHQISTEATSGLTSRTLIFSVVWWLVLNLVAKRGSWYLSIASLPVALDPSSWWSPRPQQRAMQMLSRRVCSKRPCNPWQLLEWTLQVGACFKTGQRLEISLFTGAHSTSVWELNCGCPS